MNILGISCYYHDSAACLVSDGDIVSAAQEERFTRIKHDPSFPASAIEFCLNYGGLSLANIDCIAFYDKPFIKFERILETYLAFAPKGLRSFISAVPLWMKDKLWMSEHIRKQLNGFKGEIFFPEHHESHAASAFYPSPFEEAAFITVDGVGEWATTTFGSGNGNSLDIQEELQFPHSLGLLYSAFTYYLGFKVNSGEYKVMGLAPYGEPTQANKILDNLIDLKEDGSFKLNMDYFNYCTGLTMTNENFHRLFGDPPRLPESALTQREMDIAASIQFVTNEVMMRLARHVKKVIGQRYLCLSGGVSLNCVANSKILNSGLFDDIWIQPAAGDAGGALGAALLIHYKYHGKPRTGGSMKDSQKGSYLGPSFSDKEIGFFLNANEIPHARLPEGDIPSATARLLAEGKVVGWFQGRMEYGPRALGSRSILGDPRLPEMQSTMNLKIKFRESFRPFAPAVLKEYASEYFKIDRDSPYMLFVADVREDRRLGLSDAEENLNGIERLKLARSEIPAVTHVDYSARLQTVDREDHPVFYDLIHEFFKLTGCPVVVNTSFNVRGEPIVCTPEDAYKCFIRTEMDYLVIGSFILEKKQQPERQETIMEEPAFELD